MEETTPLVGGTRGGAKDASERVKAQAVIIYWKQVARGVGKMDAAAFSGKMTNNSERTVRSWVALEDKLGMDGLESRRDNCGTVTRFSPGKKRKIDDLMQRTAGNASVRQVQRNLGLGSSATAAKYVQKSGYKKLIKRTRPLLSSSHMRSRLEYVEKHFGSPRIGHFMTDEKLFVLGPGKMWRYVKAEDADIPCIQFMNNTNHSPQLMIIAIVGRPDLAKGWNGKVAIDFTCAKMQEAQRASRNRPRGTLELKPDGTLDALKYAAWMSDVGFLRISEATAVLRRKTAGVVLQDDNATPHSRAWSTDDTGLNLGQEARRHNIKHEKQPARSPDLNVLDLYVWRVLEAGVHKREPKSLLELWEAIQAAWEEDLTPAKIECAYRLLDPVMALIQAGNGGNAFKLPHTGLTKQMREDGWDI